MPPRLVSGAIVAFWLVMTAWLIEREVVPMMLADASPSYMPNFTDEIGTPTILWFVERDGTRIGSATSRIMAGKGHTFEFHSTFLFNEKVPLLRQVNSVDRLGEDGKIRGMKVAFHTDKLGTYELRGDVVDDVLEPVILVNGVETRLFEIGKIDMRSQGSTVNTLTLVNRLRNLYEGQTWVSRRFDPFGNLRGQLIGADLLKSYAVPDLIAKVKIDSLHWHRKEVECFTIEYNEPGKDVIARTWVRRRDGLVLQQELNLFGMSVVIHRAPE